MAHQAITSQQFRNVRIKAEASSTFTRQACHSQWDSSSSKQAKNVEKQRRANSLPQWCNRKVSWAWGTWACVKEIASHKIRASNLATSTSQAPRVRQFQWWKLGSTTPTPSPLSCLQRTSPRMPALRRKEMRRMEPTKLNTNTYPRRWSEERCEGEVASSLRLGTPNLLSPLLRPQRNSRSSTKRPMPMPVLLAKRPRPLWSEQVWATTLILASSS